MYTITLCSSTNINDYYICSHINHNAQVEICPNTHNETRIAFKCYESPWKIMLFVTQKRSSCGNTPVIVPVGYTSEEHARVPQKVQPCWAGTKGGVGNPSVSV